MSSCFSEEATVGTYECTQSDEYASIVLRIQKFVEHDEGRYIHQALCRRFEIENQRMRDLVKESYAPHVAAELQVVAGRLEVLEWLANGRLGFDTVED